jgi:predicted GNAT superfamily acetyltransferase
MSDPGFEIRDVIGLDECRAVVGVQETVWGRDGETVPASVLMVSAKRGGILIGAYAASPNGAAGLPNRAMGLQSRGDLVGFVWSLAGTRDRRPTHWSHMLGVLPEWRRHGVGEHLKQAQRTRARAAGVELIEWTFDPLQAANAHFNLHALGAVGAGYTVNAYGALSGPLHRGTPTDRLMVEWWIRDTPGVPDRPASMPDAPSALAMSAGGPWLRAGPGAAFDGARSVRVPVPARFSEMQQQAPDVALEWRLAVRDAMTGLFAKGYRATDFALDRSSGAGAYLFVQS